MYRIMKKSIFLILTSVLLLSCGGNRSSNNSESYNNSSFCEIDRSGNYMDLAIERVRLTGCVVSGFQFINNTYLVQSFCPELPPYPGRIEFSIKINECGEVVSAKTSSY